MLPPVSARTDVTVTLTPEVADALLALAGFWRDDRGRWISPTLGIAPRSSRGALLYALPALAETAPDPTPPVAVWFKTEFISEETGVESGPVYLEFPDDRLVPHRAGQWSAYPLAESLAQSLRVPLRIS